MVSFFTDEQQVQAPAMQLGITDPIWTIGVLVDTALSGDYPEPPRRRGRFAVIDGGRA